MPMLAEQVNLPVVVWAQPTREAWGALVCAQQAFYPMKELGMQCRFVVGERGSQRA